LSQSDESLALYGVATGRINADDCSCLDRSLFKDAFESGKIEWRLLPTYLREDIEFSRIISHFATERSARSIFNEFPALRQETLVWHRVLEDIPDALESLLGPFAPQEVLSDRGFMMQACKQNDDVFRW